MACDPDVLRQVALFALLDDDEIAVLAGQVELRHFPARQRIYKIGEPGERAYVMVSGAVRVTTVDEDHQDVVVDEPTRRAVEGVQVLRDLAAHGRPTKAQSAEFAALSRAVLYGLDTPRASG